MKTYRNLSQIIALTAALLVTLPISSNAEEKKAPATEAKAQLMFVQTAEDFKADDKTLRLVNFAQQTLYFSDRPVRIAGHMTTAAYMSEWTAAAGAVRPGLADRQVLSIRTDALGEKLQRPRRLR